MNRGCVEELGSAAGIPAERHPQERGPDAPACSKPMSKVDNQQPLLPRLDLFAFLLAAKWSRVQMTDLVGRLSITALSQRVIWTLIKAVVKIPESVQTFVLAREEDEGAKNVCARWTEIGKAGEEKDELTQRTSPKWI